MKIANSVFLCIVISLNLIGCYDDSQSADYPDAKHYETQSIFVLDNDVYVTGWHDSKNESTTACYWKNGRRIDRHISQDVEAIKNNYNNDKAFCYRNSSYIYEDSGYTFIYKNDIYKAGRYDGKGCYWKNGVRYDISLESVQDEYDGASYGTTYSLFVSSGDLYIAGEFYADEKGTNNPITVGYVWKNGEIIDHGTHHPRSIFVYNDDVYTMNWESVYKNSVPIYKITDYSEYYNTLYVYDGDIYVSGNIDYEKACYWKNGIKTDLNGNLSESHATAIWVQNGDVYVTGWYLTNGYYGGSFFDDPVYYSKACYWKNGARIDLE